MKKTAILFILITLGVFSQENVIDKKLRLALEYKNSPAKSNPDKNSGVQGVTYMIDSIGYNPYPYQGVSVNVGTDDVWSPVVSIGFYFCYYGNSYNKLIVGANGQITFDTTKASQYDAWQISTALPNNTDMPANTICGVFRDIDVALGGNTYYQLIGTFPNRTFVISWDSIPLFNKGSGTCDGTPNSIFQLVLHESTNYIEVYVKNSFSCIQWNGGYGIIGIQDATATNAVCPPNRNYPSTWTAVNEAWRFSPISGGCSTTKVNQLEKSSSTNIYPNPSTSNITIQSSTEIGTVIIYNMFGEIVLQTKSKNLQEQIDASRFSTGIYTVQVQGRFYKLIKE